VVVITNKDKKWMTPLVKLLITRRWNAWRSGNLHLFNHFKLKVSQEIHKAKLNWSNKTKSGIKGAWTVVNEIKGKSTNNCSLENLLTDKTVNQLIDEITGKFMTNYNWHIQNPFAMSINAVKGTFIIEEHAVYNQLLQLKQNKSAGSDNITPRLLTLFAEYICGPLCAIYNESIKSCVFPDVWKLSDTLPSPKCKNPTIDQLRPIALLPIMGKDLEKHVVTHYRNDLINGYGPHQHAYRHHCSCTSALVEMHEVVTAMLDEKGTYAVRMIFFDMKAAFDKLRHDLLLERMTQHLDPGFILWCQSYLNDRKFRVKFNNQRGAMQTCPSSVPQGSILGPFLFAFFMGSLKLGKSFDSSCYHLIIYADDILLIEKITVSDLKFHVSATSIIRNWCSENDLLLNTRKTIQLFVGKRTFVAPEELDGFPVSESIKYLGVHINSKLSFYTHISDTCKKSSQRIYILRTLKPLVSIKELYVVFDALILSILRYSAPLFIGVNNTCMSMYKKFLKRCHRVLCNCTNNNCVFLCDANALIGEASVRFFNKIKDDPSHPLHKYIPTVLPRSQKYFIKFCNSERRRCSFFPYLAVELNSTICD
jgi:hypothetical protein